MSFSIPFGRSVAFVGTSGAGKTTLADIILGLLVPQCGSVYYGELNILSHKAFWSQYIGYIPQTIYLADDTIRRNIAFGIEDNRIDDDRIKKALDQAQLSGFMGELEYGIETVIGERGVKLSGGQRQRIGIARALYNDPEILVLDEATSALDVETENALMGAINYLKGEKTLIIIAHRLKTIENCDSIFLVEDGKVKEENGYIAERKGKQ